MSVVAVVPAAGRGARMGADKALLDLGGITAIERIAASLAAAGVERLLVVRREGAAPLPALPLPCQLVPVSGEGDMADSLRAAERTIAADEDCVVVLPVDHALVAADTIAGLLFAVRSQGVALAAPEFDGRLGHPVVLRRAAFAEIREQGAILRDLVRRDPARVRALPTANPWVRADLDRPDDLAAARAALLSQPLAPVALMHRHRSRRAYADTPLSPGQLERLVDAARHASTSSFIQAYAVVAVTDPGQKRAVAQLCADQPHIEQAPVFVAVCADLAKIAAACAAHGQVVQAQSLELFLQATIDAALLGQNLALAAESEGLGICMIGAARNRPVELARLLDLPSRCFVVFGMTIGHPTDDPAPRGRMPLDGVLHLERYDQGVLPAVLQGADLGMRQWAEECNRRGGYNGRPVSLSKGWQDRMAQMWGAAGGYVAARAALLDELRQLGLLRE